MLIVGNLDVEVTWARMDAAARRARGETAPSPEDPRFALPEPVMRKISAAATLLRVFAKSDEDVLWTPRPVDPSRMAEVDFLPRPQLVSGAAPDSANLWWGRTTPEAMSWNHRGTVLRFRPDERGVIVRSVAELEQQSASLERWVAKAPFSAAGRLRVRGGAAARDAARASSGLLRMYGCLLLEPWFDRSDDFGVVGSIQADRCVLEPPHRLLVDASGRFLGIEVRGRQEETGLTEIARRVGEAICADRLQGPFGVDVYRTADSDGRSRLVLSEINARMTFGCVASQLAQRLRPHGVDEAAPVTLRFGAGAPAPGTIALLNPAEDDPTSAWLEVPSRHGS